MKLVAVALCLAGCSNVDLSGTYHITTTERNSSCGGDFTGSTRQFYTVMASVDGGYAAMTYSDQYLLQPIGESFVGITFDEPIDDGWSGSRASAGAGPTGTCWLDYLVARARLSGARLTIELTRYGMPADTSCTSDEAARRNDSMPCLWEERFVGSRI